MAAYILFIFQYLARKSRTMMAPLNRPIAPANRAERHRAGLLCQAKTLYAMWATAYLAPSAFPCQRAQNAYNAAIRGSRPGAERTISAISPLTGVLMW
jgi:hypothetical protein